MTTEQPQVNDHPTPLTSDPSAGPTAKPAAPATPPPAETTTPRRRWFGLRRGSAARSARAAGAADAGAGVGPATTPGVVPAAPPSGSGDLVRAAAPQAHAAGVVDTAAATGLKPLDTEPSTTKPDSAKADATKSDSAKPDSAKAGGAKPDATKPAETASPARKDVAPARKRLPSARPPGSPPDPWTAFATTADRAPGRIRRGLRAVGRTAIHEYTLVILGSIALAVLMTWPTLRYPLYTLAQETGGPAAQAWQIAWSGHILLTDPMRLWQSNAFLGEQYPFAFTDSLLGYAPLGMIGSGPLAAVLRYNIIFVLAHALLLVGAYALVRQLGAGRTGAAVAGVAFAFAPWRLAQEGHLELISVGAIPLALAMLARGHGWSLRYGIRSDRRHAGWAFAGWMVATWQLSLGFTIGVPFAYVLAIGIVLTALGFVVRRIRRVPLPRQSWWLFAADLFGPLIFAAAGTALALPYLMVARLYPNATPDRATIDFLSPPVQSFLIGPAESRIWGQAHAVPRASLEWPTEMTLLPGFVLYALALAGLLISVWRWWHRLVLLVGVLVTAILAMGTQFFDGRWTYLPLVQYAPGWDTLRAPGRLVLWTTLFLAVLAAGAVGEFVRRAEQMSAQRLPPWPSPWLRLATMVPVVLVLAEGLNVTPHPTVPAQPTALRTIGSATVVLPSTTVDDQHALLWSTSRFQPLANGSAAFVPPKLEELRRATATFPDAASIEYLRGRGVSTVVLLRERAAGTPWERAGDVPVDALGIQREDLDDTVVFRLQSP